MSKMLTYAQFADRLGVRKETLCRNISKVNKKKEGTLKPDKVVYESINLRRYFFLPSSIERFRKEIKKVVRPVGRPRN